MLVALLTSCATRNSEDTGAPVIGIEGHKWRLVELSDESVSPQPGESGPFITFDATVKQASGFAGCNNFFGSYELDGASLTFGPVGSTRRFCEGGIGELERRLFESLEKTRAWEIKDSALTFLDGGVALARFTRIEDKD